MGKRYNFYFGDALSKEMELLASVMQDGNVKATIAELVHAEMRRRFGDTYALDEPPEPAKVSVNDPVAITAPDVVPEVADEPQEPSFDHPWEEPSDEPEVPVLSGPAKYGFKFFDPENPVGSKPEMVPGRTDHTVWYREKKQHADSLKPKLTGARA